DGSFDATFGTGGKTIVNAAGGTGYDQGWALSLLPDGRIYVAGIAQLAGNDDFSLLRFTAGGALDTTFDPVGLDGIVTTPVLAGSDKGRAIAVQADGKILVGGRSSNGSNDDAALVRYLSTGALDTTFGSGGKVTFDLGGSGGDCVFNIVQAPDG